MTIEKLDNIKRKIRSLLAHTTENGATENEACVALGKALKLMAEYNICERDIKQPEDKIGEQTIILTRRSIYLRQIIATLCDCFNCFSYIISGSKEVRIYGYDNDRKLVEYFADVILNALEIEIKNYKNSYKYWIRVALDSPNKIINYFILGYYLRMHERITFLYKKSTEEIIQTTGTDLMCIKKETVKNAFEKEYPDLRKGGYFRRSSYIKEVVDAGKESAEKVSINKGINKGGETCLIS